ncbi:MAG: spore germination protein, partial [Candidatus Desulforudis sp.]|nr:spore germination protein [Desulforudis sp.]
MRERKRRLVTRRLSEKLREAQRSYHYEQLDRIPISESLQENITVLKRIFADSPGFNVREFLVAGKHPAAVAFVEGMVDSLLVSTSILRPLMHYSRDEPVPQGKDLLEMVQYAGITT